jgi:3-isopropylmalate/(R)-2-methylmalate dehydratase small subunit
MSLLRGRIHRYGDHVNTDVIIPARYLNTSDPAEMAAHCMEDMDPEFVSRAKPGDIIVAQEDFGCGSSREQAPLAIKTAGVSCVIAASFARIFFRNSINIGLPVLVCADAARDARAGDEMTVDLATGRIENSSQCRVYQAEAFPEFLQQIVAAGGLTEYTKQRLAQR